MATFSSGEIIRQSNRVLTECNNIQNYVSEIATFCELISNEVKSEDTSLSSDWIKVKDCFEKISKRIISNGKRLSESLNQYAEKAKQNESELVTKIQRTSSSFDEIDEILDNIQA